MRCDSKPIASAIMIKEPTSEAMPQNVARLEDKVDALTETVNKLSQHIFSLKASAKDEEMICVEDASKLLHLSPSRIYALVQEGRIPCYKPGRNLLFLPSELRRWLTDNRRTGQSSVEEQIESLTKGMHNSARERRLL